jgi:acyl-CoA synthetase (AMP-forming)/AMP-acid ligase II
MAAKPVTEAAATPPSKADDGGARWLHGELAGYRGCSYVAYLRRRSEGAGSSTALIYGERAYSYSELFEAVSGSAAALDARGVRQGDRVVLQLENSDRYVVSYLAVLQAGAVAVPINPKWTAAELAFVLSDARPALYVGPDGREPLDQDGTPVRAVSADELCAASGAPALPSTERRNGDADAAIFYTSGTTGRPKGVVHTHGTLIAGALASARGWGYDRPGLVTLAVTPLFHVASHSWFYPVLANRGTLVVDTFGTERALAAIERHSVASFGAVPSMLLMMVEEARKNARTFPSVENVRFGASPMPPDRLRDVAALFPNAGLYHGMGQTESGGTISVLPPRLAFAKAGGTGFPIPGTRVRIVGADGRDVPDGSVGQVLGQSPQNMRGYFERPAETAETLAGGWLHTGDLGYRDPDGCIYLVDRIKDMIIRGGENIYSVEVENALSTHPAVAACAVVGIPDGILGERVCAVVVARRHPDAALADELKAHCRKVLAAFKAPEIIEFAEELPRTATGKIQKGPLRRLAVEGNADALGPESRRASRDVPRREAEAKAF